MALPFNFSGLHGATNSMTNDQAKMLMSNAMNIAGDYLGNMKKLAGGTPDRPMKTMAREQQDLNNLAKYYNDQGKIAPAVSTDPSAEIRRLGELYNSTADKGLRDSYHQEALKLAQNAGWLQPGQSVSSVNGMAKQSAAGEMNMDTVQQAYKNAIAEQKASRSGSSGGNGGSTGDTGGKSSKDEYMGALETAKKCYASAEDFIADLERHKGILVSYVGEANWNRLKKEATSEMHRGTFDNSGFKPGGISPIRAQLQIK